MTRLDVAVFGRCVQVVLLVVGAGIGGVFWWKKKQSSGDMLVRVEG